MTLKLQEPLKAGGTRPKGARDEREAAARVRDMFTRIAPRYDLLNHLLSFSLDHAWRRRTARRFQRVLRRTDARVLDLCCGTGDLAFALNRVRMHALRDDGAYRVPIMGADFAQPMVERARKKAGHHGRAAVFVAADALRLPFPDASFDLVTSAFGFRNLANYEEGLREIARVLKPGGQVGILEFSQPTGPMAGIFRFYFRCIMPLIGGAISGSGQAYFYLPSSVEKFPLPAELAELMRKTGFEEVSAVSWNFGSVVLHSAKLS
ncbi:MAG: bifunctional demethylmenaquinone methyltransferase/2-methoxy-6-polyprenyl-1,4-benzoquinol methylase UbiE [Candidatus Acidiferrales bacterium]